VTTRFAELDALMAENGNLTKMFSVLKPLANVKTSKDRIAELQRYFRFKDIGLSGGSDIITHDMEDYEGDHRTYIDWFTRRLHIAALAKIKRAAKGVAIAISNECVIESVGALDDTSSIIRLKQPAERAKQDFADLGVPSDHLFINMKLLTSHYHHIHSPVAGIVRRRTPIHAQFPMFGRASVNFLEIDADVGRVFLLIIGEAVVQDFDYAVEEGDRVEMCQPLGNFTWGSQVVMLAPGRLEDVRVGKRDYAFVGDQIL
jgi:hypothetical protein